MRLKIILLLHTTIEDYSDSTTGIVHVVDVAAADDVAFRLLIHPKFPPPNSPPVSGVGSSLPPCPPTNNGCILQLRLYCLPLCGDKDV